MRPPEKARDWTRLALAASVFGAVCRVAQWAWNTSFWHDEAFVVLNVLEKSWRGLLGPLDWDEAAPPGFLAVQKLVASALSPEEHAMRLVPLLAGLAGLWAFAALAREVSGERRQVFFAALFMAASSKLVVQSAEAKHFTLDLLLAAVLSRLALAIRRSERPSGLLLAWGSLGAVALWFSYASLFVLAGTSLVLLAGWPAWPPRARAAWAAANAVILGSFTLLLGPIAAQRSPRLVEFWNASRPDARGPLAAVAWLARSTVALFDYCWQPYGLALLGLGITGAVVLWRSGRRSELACLGLPVLVSLLASILGRWPFGGNQHMVFAAPAVLLLSAEGLEALRGRLAARWPAAGAAVILAVFAYRVPDAVWHAAVPHLRHEVRPVARFFTENAAPDDALICFDPATYGLHLGRDLRGPAPVPRSDQRVWILTLRNGEKTATTSGLETVKRLDAARPRLLSREEFGAAGYLWGPETPVLRNP